MPAADTHRSGFYSKIGPALCITNPISLCCLLLLLLCLLGACCLPQVWHMVFHPAGNAGLATVLAAPRYTFMHQVRIQGFRNLFYCVPMLALTTCPALQLFGRYPLPLALPFTACTCWLISTAVAVVVCP